jgi:AcrR family transcriptional regulator
MVEAIVQAGARVLGERGWAGFSTNEVAEVAGVSIGSFYQYFPDKLSLIEAIRRHHLQQVLAALRIADTGQRSPRQLVEDLVDGMIAVHAIQPALHRVLLDEVPAHGSMAAANALFEAEYQDRYQAFIAAYFSGRQRREDSKIIAQVLSGALEGVIHAGARRGTLHSPELKQELVDMLCAYLA